MPRYAQPVPASSAKKAATTPAPGRSNVRPAGPQRGPAWHAIQLKAAQSAAPARSAASGSGLPAALKAGIETLSGLAMDDVQVHRNSPEPARLGALAYAQGSNIHLGPGQERHLAHEAWHVVQQKQGRVTPTPQGKGAAINEDAGLEAEADRMGIEAERRAGPAPRPPRPAVARGNAVQLRRIPKSADLAAEFPAAGPGFETERSALARLLSRTWAALPAIEQVTFLMAEPAGLKWANEGELALVLRAATRDQIIAFADKLRLLHPESELGDLNQMEMKARPGTSDSANLQTLLTKANEIYDDIAAGNRDSDLADVFGSTNVARAKAKYARSKRQAARIISTDRVISDRSGTSDEIELGGYFFRGTIDLLPGFIDNPTAGESIITFIHECAHAGSADVDDKGYIDEPTFTRQTEAFKLTNAAHFEIAPRRKLGVEPTFTGIVFLPAAASAGAAAPLTHDEKVLKFASETLRMAWDRGVDVHEEMIETARHPRRWYTRPWVRNGLLSWSLLAKLTIHERVGTFPATWTVGIRPVSQTDVALSEGVVRKIANAQLVLPQNPADKNLMLALHATPLERADVTAAPAGSRARKEADLVVTVILRDFVQNMTGTPGSDRQLITKLERGYRT